MPRHQLVDHKSPTARAVPQTVPAVTAPVARGMVGAARGLVPHGGRHALIDHRAARHAVSTSPQATGAAQREVRHRGAARFGPRRKVGLIGLAVVIGLTGLVASATAAIGQTSSQTAGAISGVMDPAGWYLTLPTGRKGKPDTVHAPTLAGYSSTWFHLDSAKDGVVFTANAGGVTTSGSSYPRSELREMNGTRQAGWSNTAGTHTLAVRQAVTALPTAKPEVVTAQIHDASDDVLEIRLEATRLIAQYDDGHTDVTLDPHYTLGTAYDLKITAAAGRVRVYYNGAKKVDIARQGSGWYFKSGSYVQSNTSKGDKASAVASVVIYEIGVTHTS